eukprot:scaffold533533_cov33-Prasinocladus_malaysianus.AAC.1
MISVIMADQLRTVCLKSLEAYTELINKFVTPAGSEAERAGLPFETSPGVASYQPLQVLMIKFETPLFIFFHQS